MASRTLIKIPKQWLPPGVTYTPWQWPGDYRADLLLNGQKIGVIGVLQYLTYEIEKPITTYGAMNRHGDHATWLEAIDFLMAQYRESNNVGVGAGI